jgi:hypothetical protein
MVQASSHFWDGVDVAMREDVVVVVVVAAVVLLLLLSIH